MPQLNLLSQISGQQELADLGQAQQLDPGILAQPEKMGWREQLRDSMNNVTRAYGMMFHDPVYINEANRFDQQRAAEQQAQVMNRLLPVLGQAALQRSQQAEAEKRDLAEEKLRMRRFQFAEKATREGAIREMTGEGRYRSTNQQETLQAADAYEKIYQNPGMTPEQQAALFPKGYFTPGEAERQAGRDALADQKYERDLAKQEASAKRVDANRIALEEKATNLRDKKLAVEREKVATENFLKGLSAEVKTAGKEAGDDASPKDRAGAKKNARAQFIDDAVNDVLADPESLTQTTRLMAIRDQMPIGKARYRFAERLAESGKAKYGDKLPPGLDSFIQTLLYKPPSPSNLNESERSDLSSMLSR